MSHFGNAPFTIDDFSPRPTRRARRTRCSRSASRTAGSKGTGSPGGCTRDIVHRFYHEQYQLDGGKQDRYITGSDAMGLTLGVYDTKALPIYKYLHDKDHPDYAIEDNFFQAAFGGSFLNHQWLIAAASPVDPTGAPGGANAGAAPDARHERDAVGRAALHARRSSLTPDRDADCELLADRASLPAPISQYACGNWGVNTMQPSSIRQGRFGACSRRRRTRRSATG